MKIHYINQFFIAATSSIFALETFYKKDILQSPHMKTYEAILNQVLAKEWSKVKGQNITLLNTHKRSPVEYSVTVCYEKFRTNKVLFLLTSNRWSKV